MRKCTEKVCDKKGVLHCSFLRFLVAGQKEHERVCQEINYGGLNWRSVWLEKRIARKNKSAPPQAQQTLPCLPTLERHAWGSLGREDVGVRAVWGGGEGDGRPVLKIAKGAHL